MAQIKMARGTEDTILNTPADNGKIYISTNTHRLFTDLADKRIEINPGIVVKGQVNFGQDSADSNLEIKTNIDITKDTVFTMISGQDATYFTDQVYCTAKTYVDGTATFTFKRSNTNSSYIYPVQIFIYNGALTSERSIETDEQTVYSISPYSWNSNEDGTYSTTLTGISSDKTVLISSNDGNSAYYNLTGAESIDGGLVINSNYIPSSAVDIYVQYLPDTTSINQIQFYLGDGVIPIDGLSSDSVVMIQCISNEKAFQNIKQINIIDGGLEVIIPDTLIDSPMLEELIEINIIDLTNSVNIEELTLTVGGWTEVADTGYYYATQTLNVELECGDTGNNVPIIFCNENEAGFAAITDITIAEDKKSITCIASYVPNNNIGLTILDYKK